jgi:hypothetical protein
MSGETRLEMNAPQDMYTMSDQRISHVIQPHEWAQIKKGSGSELFNWALALLFGALGFAQNLWNEIYGKTPTGWDRFGAMLFFGLLFSGIALFIVSRNQKSDFDKACTEIDGRTPRPFSGA